MRQSDINLTRQFEGRFLSPWTCKPRNGLLRTPMCRRSNLAGWICGRSFDLNRLSPNLPIMIPRFSRAELGWFLYSGLANLGNCRRISQRILMAFFFFRKMFGLIFQVSGLPKNSRPKFTPRHVGIPLQLHLSQTQLFSRRFSAYRGGPTNESGVPNLFAVHSCACLLGWIVQAPLLPACQV